MPTSDPLIYLDNNATTAIDPRVVTAMVEVWNSGPLNASSQHSAGRQARMMLDQALRNVATSLGADIVTTGGDRLVLTSGGTEANNLVFDHSLPESLPRLVSRVEHPSVLEAAQRRIANGLPTGWIEVDANGLVDLEQFEAQLAALCRDDASKQNAKEKHPARGLVSLIGANNETGVLQPLESIAEICHRHGVWLHSDVTQWIGKLPFDFRASGCDAVTFAAHKFHGPVGIGGLLLRPHVHVTPALVGGGQQLATRPGTEPVALAVGMARALELALERLPQHASHMQMLRDRFETGITTALPGTTVHAAGAPRLPNTTNLSFPEIDRQTLLIRLDRARIACSTGSACSSGSSQPSHVLAAMGVPIDRIESSLRFGVSRLSTASEIELAIERISSCCNKLRND